MLFKSYGTFLLASIVGVSPCMAQNVGLGVDAPQTRLHVIAEVSEAARFEGTAGMRIGLWESTLRGYMGSMAGSEADADIGTAQENQAGMLHLTTRTVPRLFPHRVRF